MRGHRYLRAYVAGIAVPTALLLVFSVGFTVARHAGLVPGPAERFIVFPMAVVPNLWGAWNMFYAWVSDRRRVPTGAFGAALPLLIGPTAIGLGGLFGVTFPSFAVWVFPVALLCVMTFYYLLWKHLVSFLNALLEVGAAG